ncbi:hypothetical protein [Phormidesmis priestleyi]
MVKFSSIAGALAIVNKLERCVDFPMQTVEETLGWNVLRDISDIKDEPLI